MPHVHFTQPTTALPLTSMRQKKASLIMGISTRLTRKPCGVRGGQRPKHTRARDVAGFKPQANDSLVSQANTSLVIIAVQG